MQQAGTDQAKAFNPLNPSATEEDFLNFFGEGEAAADDNAQPSGSSPEAEGKTFDQEDGREILAADGKHYIPNAVLKEERKQRQEAQRLAEEREQALAKKDAEIAALKEQMAANPGKKDEEEGDDDFSDEDIADLMADSPVLGKIARKQAKLLKSLEEERANIAAATKATPATQEPPTHNPVDDVVDTIPQLRYWGHQDPAKWQEACAIDEQLRSDPRFKDLHTDMEARFKKVVQIMEAKHGETQLPSEYMLKTAAQARAKAIVESSESQIPLTLSDLPGGEPPGNREVNWEAMSPHEIDRMLTNMTPQQQEAFLARYAA